MCSHKRVKLMVMLKSYFKLGQDILYTDGEVNQMRAVYKGATPDGLWHTLSRQDSFKLVIL